MPLLLGDAVSRLRLTLSPCGANCFLRGCVKLVPVADVAFTQPSRDVFTPQGTYLLAAYSFTRLRGARANTDGGETRDRRGGAFWVADLVIWGDLLEEPLSMPPDPTLLMSVALRRRRRQ